MSDYTVEAQKLKLAKLTETTGTVRYFVRLNPKIHEGGSWRECGVKEYFTSIASKYFGGLIQVKTEMDYYNESMVREAG